jgi:hypothetical protein
MKLSKRIILVTTAIGALLAFNVFAATFPEFTKCPKDDEDAQRTYDAEEYTHSDKCPENVPNTPINNAIRASYSHQHVAGPFIETHKFYLIQCLK